MGWELKAAIGNVSITLDIGQMDDDKKRILCCALRFWEQYHFQGVFLSDPVHIGRSYYTAQCATLVEMRNLIIGGWIPQLHAYKESDTEHLCSARRLIAWKLGILVKISLLLGS